jgi:hypothetical protein
MQFKLFWTLAASTLCATALSALPAQAQTQCWWENDVLRCRDGNSNSDRYNNDRYNNDRYNNDRYDRDRYDNDRYDRDRYDDDRRDLEEDIDDLYREVLGRPADSSGLRTYVRRVEDDGWNLDRVRRDLAESSELDQAIDRAYREILGRPADSRGLRTYGDRVRNGWSMDRVRQDLANSSEARNRGRR